MAQAAQAASFAGKAFGDFNKLHVPDEFDGHQDLRTPEEEARLLEETFALLPNNAHLDAVDGDFAAGLAAEVWPAVARTLACLRARKYAPERAALLRQNFDQFRTQYFRHDDGTPLAQALLKHDMAQVMTQKVMTPGFHDPQGRVGIWVRLRFHEPTRCKCEQMLRLVGLNIEHAIKTGGSGEAADHTAQRDAVRAAVGSRAPEAVPRSELIAVAIASCPPRAAQVQASGAFLVNDMDGLSFKNLDHTIPKRLFGALMGGLPVRVAKIYVRKAPWVLDNIVLPIAKKFMKKKMAQRIETVSDAQLLAILGQENSLVEHGGKMVFNLDDHVKMLHAVSD